MKENNIIVEFESTENFKKHPLTSSNLRDVFHEVGFGDAFDIEENIYQSFETYGLSFKASLKKSEVDISTLNEALKDHGVKVLDILPDTKALKLG